MSDPQHYLVCLDLAGRSCLVVGGGAVGLEKTRGLLACGARVTVVAPEVDEAFAALDVEVARRPFEPDDLDGRFLVVAATERREVNQAVWEEAERRGRLCNVADVPDLCNFILPAVHREGPIAIAVSTGGASPALAQRLRDDCARLVGPRHAELARRLRALRPWAKERFPTYAERRAFFAALVREELG